MIPGLLQAHACCRVSCRAHETTSQIFDTPNPQPRLEVSNMAVQARGCDAHCVFNCSPQYLLTPGEALGSFYILHTDIHPVYLADMGIHMQGMHCGTLLPPSESICQRTFTSVPLSLLTAAAAAARSSSGRPLRTAVRSAGLSGGSGAVLPPPSGAAGASSSCSAWLCYSCEAV